MGDGGTGAYTVFLIAPIIVIALLLRSAHGRWLAPGPMFMAFWAVWIVLPAVVAPDFPVSYTAVGFIVLLVSCFGVGALAASHKQLTTSKDRRVPGVNARLIRKFVTVGAIAGVAASALILPANGQSVSGALSSSGLLASASDLSVSRYTGSLRVPFFVPPLLGLTYAAAFLGTFAARETPSSLYRAFFLAGPALSASLYATVTTARSGMLTAVCFVFAGWVTESLYRTGRVPKLNPRTVVTTSLVVALTGGAFVALAFVRVGSVDASTRILLTDKMRVYSVGYMGAFSQWWEGDTVPEAPEKWGLATFAGLDVSPKGDGEYSAGYSDVRQVGPSARNTTNIFTAWRDLISDVGIFMSTLVSASIGFVTTRWWRAVTLGRATFVVPFAAGYGYLLQSVTLPIYMFTNTCMAVAVAWIVFHAATRPIGTVNDRQIRIETRDFTAP